MTLRHEPDVSVADWIVEADAAWGVIAGHGPPGFDEYVTVPLDGGPVDTDFRSDEDVVRDVVVLAARFTDTPDRAWSALWDGWGDIDGGLDTATRYVEVLDGRTFGRVFRPPARRRVASAFGRDVMRGPKVDLRGMRRYYLFTGAVEHACDWGAAPYLDRPRPIGPPALVWPADHAWCLAADVDDESLTIGGSRDLVDAVLALPDLRAEPATYGVLPPD
jgi:hypothetical protein